jgi:nicotinamidase-related amidase
MKRHMMDKTRSAYLSMDMQNSNTKGRGRRNIGTPKRAKEIGLLANSRRALMASREAGVLVIHVRVAFRKEYPEFGGIERESSPLFSEMKKEKAFLESEWDSEIADEVSPLPGEIVITKSTVSPFTGTDLDRILRNNEIKWLFLTGASTNNLIMASVYHASDLGYVPIVIRDCVAGYAKEIDEFLLDRIIPIHAIVLGLKEYLSIIRGGNVKCGR